MSTKLILVVFIAAVVVGALIGLKSSSTQHPLVVPCPATSLPSNRRKAAQISAMFDIPLNVTYVVIDVGTNVNGEFAPVCAVLSDCYYIAVEPLTGERTVSRTCNPAIGRGNANASTWKQRCTVLTAAVAPSAGWATFRVAASVQCSSLSAGGTGCGAVASTITVPLIPLDDIIDMIPRKLPIKMISLDCQGNDFEAASSLKKYVSRVGNMVAELQDLPLNDSRWIYQNDHNKNAGHLRACITQRWGWRETGSTWNTRRVRELNMHFSNPSHPLSECVDAECKTVDLTSHWRHLHRNPAILEFDNGTCPDEDF